MPDQAIRSDATVKDVMDAFPSTVDVFVRRRMHCPGCTMSPFMTVAEAARTYTIDIDLLVNELRDAAIDRGARERPA